MTEENIKLPATERLHHPYSPSTTQTLEASPCAIPRSGPGCEAAQRGTAQHDASEKEEDSDDLSDDEADAVLQTKILLDEAVLAMGPGAIVEKEEYLPIDDETQVDSAGHVFLGTTGGYDDVTIWSADRALAHVIDWKFGKYAVEPAGNNTQGMSYALGVQHKALKNGWKLHEVKVTFFSPHIEDQSEHVFDVEALALARVRINLIVERAKLARAAIAADPDHLPNYSPSTTGCMFCGRLAVCPAAREWVVSIAKKYKPLSVPADIFGLELTPDSAQTLKDFTTVVGSWAKEVNNRIHGYTMENPDFIPTGYRLIQTFPRSLINPRVAIPILIAELGEAVVYGGTGEDDSKGIIRMNITTVEKAVSDKAPRGQKEAAKEAIAEKLNLAGCLKKAINPVVSLRKKGKDDASGS